MIFRAQWIGCVAMIVVATAALAQEITENSDQSSIASEEQKKEDASIMTTHKDAPSAEQQPQDKPHESLPWSKPEAPAPAKPATSSAPAKFQGAVPFGHVEIPKPVMTGPRAVSAVPVEGVDAIESSEPAPPTPIAPEANPAQENPEQPTELTSPMFKEEPEPRSPRKIVLRVLNKVTAQSQLLKFKPGETIAFGQLRILGVTCQASAPNSQSDYAALLDITEEMPTGQPPKPLFRGWMYASSPSITSLEHPVYDVTMALCDIAPAGSKEESDKPKEKQDAKPKESATSDASKDKPKAKKK